MTNLEQFVSLINSDYLEKGASSSDKPLVISGMAGALRTAGLPSDLFKREAQNRRSANYDPKKSLVRVSGDSNRNYLILD